MGVGTAPSGAAEPGSRLAFLTTPDTTLWHYALPKTTTGQSNSPALGWGTPSGTNTLGPRIHNTRAIAWGAFSAGALYLAYEQSQAVWGESSGKFHFKDDLVGDGMALSDETSHAFVAFQLTEFISDAYAWVGVERNRARRIGALEAWALTFLTEFPIDAYNPDQGFGVSDLVFNTAGILAAYHRTGQERPRWDAKISVKQRFFEGDSRLIAHTNRQYDDYIYWLTVRPSMNRYIPVHLGLGYSTDHDDHPIIAKNLHLGIGTSLEEIGGLFGERTARALRHLNFFYFNINTKITWQ